MKQILIALVLVCALSSPFVAAQLSGTTFTNTIQGVTFSQTTYNFTQLIDHFNIFSNSTFLQRFTVYSEYFNQSNGTVFISIGGESAMSGISNGRSWLLQLAKQFNAIVFSVEHRYYGISQPYGYGEKSYTTNNLKQLTADQALEDLAVFIQTLKTDPNYVNQFGVGDRNPFITIGGSYPGALSAWFRAKYPHLTVGALASSAVVNAIVDFSEYDLQVYYSTNEVDAQCPINIKAFNDQVETIVQTSFSQQRALQKQFNASALTDLEFLYYVVDVQASLVQYGNSVKLCNIFNSAEYATNLSQFLSYLNSTNGYIPAPVGYTQIDLWNTTYDPKKNMRQWQYQVCTQYGWLQTANNIHPMRSSQLNVTYFLKQCSDIFQETTLPSAIEINQYWGGVNIQATNLVFTNGSQDPWKWASLLTSKKNITSIVTDCIGCAHGCELGYTVEDEDEAITVTKNKVLALFQEWTSAHIAKYAFTQLPVASSE